MCHLVNPFHTAKQHVQQQEKEEELIQIEKLLDKCTAACFDALSSLQLDTSLMELECDFIEKSLQIELQQNAEKVDEKRNVYLRSIQDLQGKIITDYSSLANDEYKHRTLVRKKETS